ncbi:MAG: SEC-C metal-binding domain-containing protein [Methylococcaceae bacterium]
MKLNRNDICHCGSGKKYKKCCLLNDEKQIVSLNIDKSSPLTLLNQGAIDSNAVTATLTGEYTQPVRLCYKVYDKHALHSKIFKNMKCMSYDSPNSRWVWLFDHEAKNLSFEQKYNEIPKHLRPIVIGSFFSANDDEMHLDVRSHERAIHAITFFDRYIPRNIAEVTDAIMLSRIIKPKEMSLLNDFNNFFKDVTIVDKAKEFEEIMENSKNEINPKKSVFSFLKKSVTKAMPEVERIRTNYYEDGIDSIKLSLQVNRLAALNKLNGKELTTNDIVEMMHDTQLTIDDK